MFKTKDADGNDEEISELKWTKGSSFANKKISECDDDVITLERPRGSKKPKGPVTPGKLSAAFMRRADLRRKV